MLHVCDAYVLDDSVSLAVGGVLSVDMCGIVKWVPECVAADVWLLIVADVFVSAGRDRELSCEAVSSPGEARGGC